MAGWKEMLGLKLPHSYERSERPKIVIAGLGNPGTTYRGTRHNVGFEVIDGLADHLGAEVKTKKFGARIGETQVHGMSVMLVKPQEFMNRSGQAVAAIMGFYKLPLDRLLVIADDAALETGRLRLRPKGSAGGHNGLADIIEKLKSQEFARLRVGIGSAGGRSLVEHVLSRPDSREQQLLRQAEETAVHAVLCWVIEGTETAMNRYNGKETAGSAENEP